jgi:hypothetical protein
MIITGWFPASAGVLDVAFLDVALNLEVRDESVGAVNESPFGRYVRISWSF